MAGYPIDLAYAHYRRPALYTLAYPVVVAGAFDTGNERIGAPNAAQVERLFTAVLDLDCAEFLD